MTAPRAFTHLLRVRYGECDAQGIVFNARYGDDTDLAATEFMRALGLIWFTDDVVVRQTTEWRAPSRFDGVLALGVWSSAQGTTSFTLQTELRLAGNPALRVRAETVYVVSNLNTGARAPLPPELRAALERGAPGQVSDHAGFSER